MSQKKRRKSIKKPRTKEALDAIQRKGGAHKDRRNKRKKSDDLWKKEQIN